MIDFKDTKIAFISKSIADLKKASTLYRVMGNAGLTKISKAMTQFATYIRFPINWAVKPTIYSQFVGGETIEECLPTVSRNAEYKVKSILDYSVEGTESDEGIATALEETLKSIENAAQNPHIPFAVFKPTAFTRAEILTKVSAGDELTEKEKIEAQQFKERIRTLCRKAHELDIPILIDAEESWNQSFIDDTVDEMMQEYNREKAIVFNTWQMYRHDRLAHLEQTYQKALAGGYFIGAKFVRGAYMEKERERAQKMGYPSPICKNKQETDKSYDAALRFAFAHRDKFSVFAGTHNEKSVLLLADLIQSENIAFDNSQFWFSQLFGMSDNISFNMARAGYNVAKYLPYGPVKFVLPYLFRRAEENTSVKGQTGRELQLIRTEIKRRKSED
ncbi:MAG: proline dehydrogenase [Bacteroidia bacterium]|nr:MAG: proline dehydrogenase [Bacteroidia bacterium]